MIRELRRRLLLRAHSAAKRFSLKPGPNPEADDLFVAGWLAGYRSARLDFKKKLTANYQYGSFPGKGGAREMPDGAIRTMCAECGYTFGTHRDNCSRQNP